MNNISLIGRLTSDPKLVETERAPVCELRIAVDNGRYNATFIDVRTFGEGAYACAEYLRKGRRVGVNGKLAFSEWRAEDGEKKSRYSVIGRVDFLDRPLGEGGREAVGGPPADSAPEAPAEREGELVAA